MAQVALFLLFIAVNFISLALFGIDKFSSMRRGWRVPESTLLLVAFVGPIGAFIGMLVFRHKTRKTKFVLVPIFLAFQLFLLIFLNLV